MTEDKFRDRRSISGDKPDPDEKPKQEEPRTKGGKRPALPDFFELFDRRPLPELSPAEFAMIMRKPHENRPDGMLAADAIYALYDRVRQIEIQMYHGFNKIAEHMKDYEGDGLPGSTPTL